MDELEPRLRHIETQVAVMDAMFRAGMEDIKEIKADQKATRNSQRAVLMMVVGGVATNLITFFVSRGS